MSVEKKLTPSQIKRATNYKEYLTTLTSEMKKSKIKK